MDAAKTMRKLRRMASPRLLQSPVLVGRDEVLAVLARKTSEAAAGRGQALLISGEAGIGKSRVVSTLNRQARQAGFRVAQGDLGPHDQLLSLASLHDLARWMDAGEFGELGPDLLRIGARHDGDSLSARRVLVHELTDRIIAAIDRPTSLVFEDVHWADELTLEVIGELARHAASKPLLVVAAFRPEELPAGSIHREWRARLLTQRVAEEIVLERLTPPETAQVVTLILGTGLPAPRDIVDAVYDRTNGIPLHIEELLAAMGGTPSDGWAIRDAEVPSTIEDAVLARSSRLSPDAQATVRAGAVMGRCFAPEVLAGVMGRSPLELDDALDELVAAGFLYPFQWVDQGYFDFRHQLLRDAIYASVPSGELRRFHARAAEFGAELIGASEVHKSVHYERAGMKAQAFRSAVAGAKAAAAVTSRFESFQLYRRAVANMPEGLPAGEAADVWMAYCYAGFAVDEVAAAEQAATMARRLYLEAGRRLDAIEALLSLASLTRRDVRPRTERKRLLEQADREIAEQPASRERAATYVDLRMQQAVLALDAADLVEARRVLKECTAFAAEAGFERSPSEVTALDIDHQFAWADALGGDASALPRMLALSRAARDASYEATGVTNYRITADVAARVMDYETSAIGVAEGIRYADEVEQSYCRHVMAATSGIVTWASGRWDEAVQIAELELVQRGSRRGSMGSRAVLAFVAFGRGDVERARALLDASLAISRPSGEVDLVLPALWAQAETALVDGDPARALDHCWEAIELAEPTGERALLVPFVVTGVRAALLDRRPEVAQKWLDRITALLTAWPDLARPAIDHAEGLLRTATGATVVARTALESAVAGWDGRGRIWESTWARLDLAAALIRGNRSIDAVPILDDVLATARRLGSLPILRRAEELGRMARSRAGEQEPWHPLSTREFEVAALVAAGMTNGEIAGELFVSPKTVSAHIEHILAKLGAARRAEIGAWVATVRRLEPSAETANVAEAAPAR
jgi:DNA-binding CsgD family transcriptional regulator